MKNRVEKTKRSKEKAKKTRLEWKGKEKGNKKFGEEEKEPSRRNQFPRSAMMMKGRRQLK